MVRKMYKRLDKILIRLVKEIYRRFQAFRTLPFDELNVALSVQVLYADLQDMAFNAFLEIAKYYYKKAADEDAFTEYMLLELLRTPSPVMKYSYDSEVYRKRDRFVEALIATKGDVSETDKAMKYWTRMIGWFGVEVADTATERGRKDKGVTHVMWCSEHDDRVCKHCHLLDGLIFPIDEVPPKPHPGCRCWTEVVTEVV